MSPDGKYIASAGIDKKIYVWILEAALKNVVDADDGNAKLKERPAQPRVVCPPIQAKKTGVAIYGNDFFGNESDHASRRAALPASPSSLIRWRRLLSSIHSGTRPLNASQPIERRSRHWNINFKLFSGGHSTRTVDVPLAQDENRIGIVPESDAEAAAAMQRTNSNQADSSTQLGQSTGARPSQAPIQTEAPVSTDGAEDFVYPGVSCCGFFFGLRRPAPHRS